MKRKEFPLFITKLLHARITKKGTQDVKKSYSLPTYAIALPFISLPTYPILKTPRGERKKTTDISGHPIDIIHPTVTQVNQHERTPPPARQNSRLHQ